MSLVVETRDAMHELGERLSRLLRAGDLVVLAGGLGAGKTTLTQGIGRGLGVRGDITSPTFVIARVHPSLVDGPPLVHVDDLDLDASLEESVTVVEWGEDKVEDLSEDRLLVTLERPVGGTPSLDDLDEPRTVSARGVGARWLGVDVQAALAPVAG